MFNKNSGDRTTFYHSKLAFLTFFLLQAALSQACLRYSGSDCIQCALGFQLVSGGCVSTYSTTSNPILIFMDIPGVQKVLYSVNPVLLTASNSSNQTQVRQNVVSEFKVVKVNNQVAGNYYEVRASTTTAIQNVNKLLSNSSLLKEINQTSQKINQNESVIGQNANNTSLSFIKQDNQNESDVHDASSAILTAIKQAIQEANSAELNLTSIKQANSSTNLSNFTRIKQSSPVNSSLTVVKQAAPSFSGDPSLTLIKQTVSDHAVALIQVNEANQALSDENLTKVDALDEANQTSQQFNITSSNQNNSDLLIQLQQINQKLTQIDQSFSLTQAKMNQQEIYTPVSLTQVGQNQKTDQNGGSITLQLTQVGQQLTQVNQQLAQAKLTQSQSPAQNTEIQTSSISNQAQTPLSFLNQTTTNQVKIDFNISQFELTPQTQAKTQQNDEISLIAAKKLVNINWIQATRYELYNLTLVPQALTQAKLRQSSNLSAEVMTFKCNSNITLFVPPSLNPESSDLEVKYSKYALNISSIIAKQLLEYTQADRSTLCFDPPFHRCLKYLKEKHNAVIANLPLFAVYYQFCGFAKNFRVFFVDDTSLPNITVFLGQVVVDLFRMAPAEVFFTRYDSTTLRQ